MLSRPVHHRPLRTIARALALAIAVAIAATPLARAGDDSDDTVPTALKTIDATAGAFVHVEVTLRYDDGQPPSTVTGGTSNAGLIVQERPWDFPGIVLAPDRVLISDPEMDPRFVESIQVVVAGRRVKAKPFAWAAGEDGLVLATETALEGVKAPVFDASAPPPYRAVYRGRRDGLWRTAVGPCLREVVKDEQGHVETRTWAPALIVDKGDRVVGVALRDHLDVGPSWKGDPLAWPLVAAEEHERLVARTAKQADASLRRVHLRFRSPKTEGGSNPFHFGRGDDEEGDKTERDVAGVVVGARRVLVLSRLDAKTTARLESIEVVGDAGAAVPAKFVCSYRFYGALLVETDQDLAGAVALLTKPVRDLRDQLLLDARLEIQGERRVLHVADARLSSFEEGWRRQVVPEVEDSPEAHFLFDREGALVAVPVQRRLAEPERGWRSNSAVLLPGEYVAPLLADPTAHADPANTPVVAEREGRLAWLGVEVQPLDRDLARANGVSHLTEDGRSGVLVSYVYPGSPAEQAGLEPGYVLLRLVVPDRPKPIDIAGSDDPSERFSRLYEGLGEIADEVADRIPGAHPWPSAENSLNRTLTETGIGKPFTLEYAVNGEVKKAEMKVVEGPAHFEAAPLHKSEALGVTVRDLTYEVRRYYQIDAATPGVIVSKVERGGRAAVAGLRRLDIVLRVGDQPVSDAAAFAKAIEAPGEVRLTVKDKLKERVVKIAEAAQEAEVKSPPR